MFNKVFKALRFFSTIKHCKLFKDEPSKYTQLLSLQKNSSDNKIFRLIDLSGNLLNESFAKNPIFFKIYETMVKTEEMDNILNLAQAKGQLIFYITSFGEVATTVASTAALNESDLIFPQYREQGSLLWRGFGINECTNQCVGNCLDLDKGRQMPMNYGAKRLNFVTVSAPLATQIPQAAGAGYAFRIRNENKIAAVYFGDGAASEGDFHGGLNFAATLNCQTLFMCRNNQYAISTPSEEQYKGNSIAERGNSYGIAKIRVDGNDALAVFESVKAAREYILKKKEPALIEFITYRVGDHSTSHDSDLYRDKNEALSWSKNNNPITRLGKYLEKYHHREFNGKQDEEMRAKYSYETIQALKNSISELLPPINYLFSDVYDEPTSNLKEQRENLIAHLKKYEDYYKIRKFKP